MVVTRKRGERGPKVNDDGEPLPSSQQIKFCEEYMKNGDIHLSAKRAYPTRKLTYVQAVDEVFRAPTVQLYLSKMLEERQTNNKATISAVLAAFLRIAKNAEAEGQYTPALRAWEDVARYLGMFLEKPDINAAKAKLLKKSDADIDEEVARLAGLHKNSMSNKEIN